MKKVNLFFLLMILAVTFVGCSFKDPIQDDILKYVNEDLPPIASLEAESVLAYQNATGDNYKDDNDLYQTLELNVIPKYRDFVNELETISPDTKELRNIHEVYIEAANNQLNAFLKVQSAIENQDSELIIEANQMLADSRAKLRQWQGDLKDLAKEHNVDLNQ